jgi:hypothetical protein
MLILLFAAHQGEEFVLILPAIMLVGAWFIIRWANQPTDHDPDAVSARPEAEEELDDSDEGLLLLAARQASVEPPHEGDSSNHPNDDDRWSAGLTKRIAEDQHQQREREHAEQKQ